MPCCLLGFVFMVLVYLLSPSGLELCVCSHCLSRFPMVLVWFILLFRCILTWVWHVFFNSMPSSVYMSEALRCAVPSLGSSLIPSILLSNSSMGMVGMFPISMPLSVYMSEALLCAISFVCSEVCLYRFLASSAWFLSFPLPLKSLSVPLWGCFLLGSPFVLGSGGLSVTTTCFFLHIPVIGAVASWFGRISFCLSSIVFFCLYVAKYICFCQQFFLSLVLIVTPIHVVGVACSCIFKLLSACF